MSTLWKKTKSGQKVPDHPAIVTCDVYEPVLGAPFKVLLFNSVKQLLSASGEVVETNIPNMAGLLKAVAASRALCDRKFSPADVKFVRKALGKKGGELADLIGISPEHLSRCENGDRVLSVSAEKLLRVIAVEARYDTKKFESSLGHLLSGKLKEEDKAGRLTDIVEQYRLAVSDHTAAILKLKISAVHDADQELEFGFSLKEVRGSQSSDAEPEYEPRKAA
jgi:DNA-binding transcriptional regulator YiaG